MVSGSASICRQLRGSEFLVNRFPRLGSLAWGYHSSACFAGSLNNYFNTSFGCGQTALC